MKLFFDTRLDKEFLLSEKLRTSILACIFFTAAIIALTIFLFFSNSGTQELQKELLIRIFYFQTVLFVFELLALLYIIRHIRKKIYSIPLAGQYLNMIIEITAPGIIMLMLAEGYRSPVEILHSPVTNVYFIFIILSTLRLNFILSFFTGLYAAASFYLVSIYLIRQSGTNTGEEGFLNEYVMTAAKSAGLLVAGIGAGFVSRQIKQGVSRSFIVAEKANKVVNMFGQQISKEIVDEMLENEGNLQSRIMKVAIMFIDIRNFTKFVLNKTPDEIVKYQNTFFSIVVNAITKHQGIVNQFLGDGCMVTFGAPEPLINPARHAVKAAIEIQEELEKEIKNGNIPATRIGIGIHTGEAVTGNIGNSQRQQYSITGNVVILASRIEQLNKEFDTRILISEEVNKNFTGNIKSTPEFLGKINLKGWSEPVGIYKVA